MSLHLRKKRYLLSGRHSWYTSRLAHIALFAVLAALVIFGIIHYRNKSASMPSVSGIYEDWKESRYKDVYAKSDIVLSKRPLDGEMLALKGFAAYYLFSAQTDTAEAQGYLTDSIVSLRNAWYRVASGEKPKIAYILGKAYFHRGFYYADLAMKYLQFARDAGITYPDLPEFIGLTADVLGNNETAIASFTEALSVNPSDLLLFTLSRSYQKAGNVDKAKQYLSETIRVSGDELLQNKCRYEIGMILIAEGKVDEAETEFNTILEKEPNSADAQYGLGVVCETRGDLVKARAAWRRALRINPVHEGARQKMNI